MTLIEPGKFLTLNKPGQSDQCREIVKDIQKLIEGASPWSSKLIIRNKTKGCQVEVSWVNDMMTITCTNPDDEIFKLENPLPEVVSDRDERCKNEKGELSWCCEFHRIEFCEKNT